MLRAAELEVRFAGGECIAIQEQGLRAAVPWLAAKDRVLAAFPVADVVGHGAVRTRHRGVVLLDASLHLGKQRLLQRLGMSECGLGVLVFLPEIGADPWIERRWIPHHLLPIL